MVDPSAAEFAGQMETFAFGEFTGNICWCNMYLVQICRDAGYD